MTRHKNNQRAAWETHEDHVASLYRYMGYQVTPNIAIHGQQSDIVCEKWIPGAGKVALYVDAKHSHGTTASVSKADVDAFIYTFHNRRIAAGWTAGVLVSNKPFTQSARAAAAPHIDITLKTVAELEDELLALRAYLHSRCRYYETEHLFQQYVPLQARWSSSLSEADPQDVDLHSEVLRWLQVPSDPQLTLLGDFGSGKSTYLQFIQNDLASRYLDGKGARIPLFIPLRDYYDAASGPELLERFFSLECGTHAPFTLIAQFLREGRFLLLFDGFDEMGASSDARSRARNYLKLSQLMFENTKAIITCRPAYFISSEELSNTFSLWTKQVSPAGSRLAWTGNSAFDFAVNAIRADQAADNTIDVFTAIEGSVARKAPVVRLKLFSESQVRTYLKKAKARILELSKRHHTDESIYRLMKRVYDLRDLSRRPILLHLITETLPRFRPTKSGRYSTVLAGKRTSFSDITPSVLYKVYTEEELTREYSKSAVRWLVDRHVKRELVECIAYKMFELNAIAAHTESIVEVLDDRASVQGDMAHILTDIRTCSFIVRDAKGHLRFTHKSFLEYFAAQYILRMLNSGSDVAKALSESELSEEVMYFLGDALATMYPSALPRLKRAIKTTGPAEGSTALNVNVVNVLNYARDPLAQLAGVPLRRLIYSKITSKSILVSNCNIGHLVIKDCKFEELHIVDCCIEKMEVADSMIGLLAIRQTQVMDCRIARSRVVLQGQSNDVAIAVESTVFDGFRFHNGTMYAGNWQNVSAKDFQVTESLIGSVDDNHIRHVRSERGLIRRCYLLHLNVEGPLAAIAEFSDCIFVSCRTSELSLPKGFLNNEGLVLNTSSVHDELARSVYGPRLVSRDEYADLGKALRSAIRRSYRNVKTAGGQSAKLYDRKRAARVLGEMLRTWDRTDLLAVAYPVPTEKASERQSLEIVRRRVQELGTRKVDWLAEELATSWQEGVQFDRPSPQSS